MVGELSGCGIGARRQRAGTWDSHKHVEGAFHVPESFISRDVCIFKDMPPTYWSRHLRGGAGTVMKGQEGDHAWTMHELDLQCAVCRGV